MRKKKKGVFSPLIAQRSKKYTKSHPYARVTVENRAGHIFLVVGKQAFRIKKKDFLLLARKFNDAFLFFEEWNIK